jgi:hypothetical protein
MDRTKTLLQHMPDTRGNEAVPGAPADRIGLVWLLTREVTSLSKRHDAERRLQRNVTSVIRREG